MVLNKDSLDVKRDLKKVLEVSPLEISCFTKRKREILDVSVRKIRWWSKEIALERVFEFSGSSCSLCSVTMK
jgi:hypothetical protein